MKHLIVVWHFTRMATIPTIARWSDKSIDIKRIKGKKVFLSSVTDCYNHYEEKYEITRNILKQLVNSEVHVSIATKSQLILRDMDNLKQIKDLKIALPVNTLNEEFRKAMDKAAMIEERLMILGTACT